MSLAPMRICSGCRQVMRGPCPKCSKARVQAYDKQRGTAAERGYDTRWKRYRDSFLEEHPFCGDRPVGAPQTADSECAKLGLPVKANVVDHIIPVTGPDDPTFYQPEAHQALCDPCHQKKRQREAMAARVYR